MTDRQRVGVLIEAIDKASADLRKIGAEAKRMGGDVERSGQQAERGFRGVGRSSEDLRRTMTAAGAALGAVTSALALAGRAAFQQESQVRSLNFIYEESSQEIQDWARSVQDATTQSDDAARTAAIGAGILATEFGFTADQITEMIDRTNDLTAVFVQADGTQMNLAEASGRVRQAMLGEAESARALGVVMDDNTLKTYAASQGFTNWSTTMTASEKAAIRLQFFMEQTTGVIGAAAAEADTAHGSMLQFRNELQDMAASAGRALGPVGEVAAGLAPIALALPLIGGAAGRALPAVAALGAALGPVGLVGAGLAAAGAIAYLTLRHEDQKDIVVDVDAATSNLIDTLDRLARAGQVTTPQFLNIEAWNTHLTTILQLQEGYDGLAESVAVAASEAARAAGEATTPGHSYAVYEEALERTTALIERFAFNEEEATRVAQLLNQTVQYQGEAFDAVSAHINEAFADFERGRIDIDGLIRRLEAVPQVAIAAAQAQAEAAATATLAAQAFRALGDGVGVATVALEGGHASVLDYLDAQQQQTAATEAQTEVLARAATTAELAAQAFITVGDGVGAMTVQIEGGHASLLDLLDAQQAQTQATEAQTAALATRAAASDLLTGRIDAEVASQVALIGQTQSSIDAMDSFAFASYAAADGVVTLAEQSAFLGRQIGEFGVEIGEVGGQIGQTNSALKDMEEAYAILNQRRADGIALSAEENSFLVDYEARVAAATANVEDWEVAQGLLAARQLDAIDAQENLNETMGETNDSVGDLVDVMSDLVAVLAELAGIDLDNLAPPERTAIAWTELAQGIALARGELAGYIATVAGDASGGPAGSGGNAAGPSNRGPWVHNIVPTPSAPANLPPPSQTLLSPQTVVATTQVVKFGVDIGDVEEALVSLATYIEGVVGEDVTYTIVADADGAYAVLEDVDSNVRAVVTDDYVVFIEGNADGALSDIEAVELALGAIDGDTAIVTVSADASRFRNTVDGLLGFQGNAYVNVYGVPANRVGPSDLTLASGGVIEAAYGRVVRAGELSPELVYPPGGSPYLAAQDGLYVMQPGSYVSNGAATAARGVGPNIQIRQVVIQAGPGANGRRLARDFVAEMTAIGR